MSLIPSPQQQDIINFVQSSNRHLIVKAAAGCGKTSTIYMVVEYLQGNAVICAFNKSIANELESRLAQMPELASKLTVATMHSLGFRAWKSDSKNRRCRVDSAKVKNLILELDALGDLTKPFAGMNTIFLSRLVAAMKQAALLPDCPVDDLLLLIDHFDLDSQLNAGDEGADDDTLMELLIEDARQVLTASNFASSRTVDFDDMIYMPLITPNLSFTQFDNVVVDEAQDLNYSRMLLAKKLMKPKGRFIAVGDPKQAIYGFTGADAKALETVASLFGISDTLPLNNTFRCPKKVVETANQYVPDFFAHETNAEGSVRTIDLRNSDEKDLWAEDLSSRSGKMAILCRNNAPNVRLAMQFLRKNIGCFIEGRDIGAQLIAVIKKQKMPAYTDLGDFQDRFRQWFERQERRFSTKGKKNKVAQLNDQFDAIMAVCEGLEIDLNSGEGVTVGDLILRLDSLFKDSSGSKRSDLITLSSIHKAKGREWPFVYILGANAYMPSKYAKQPWEFDQEDNLFYVAITRAQEELIWVEVQV